MTKAKQIVHSEFEKGFDFKVWTIQLFQMFNLMWCVEIKLKLNLINWVSFLIPHFELILYKRIELKKSQKLETFSCSLSRLHRN